MPLFLLPMEAIIWDRFYHVILSTDAAFLKFITELNLHHELFWQETKTGFYGVGCYHWISYNGAFFVLV